MLSYSSRNNNLVLSVLLTPSIESFNHFLWLHQIILRGVGRNVGEGESLLPLFDFVEPFGTGESSFGKKGKESSNRFDDVSGDGDVGVDNFVDVLGLDFEMNDSSSTFFGGLSSSGSEG